MFVATGVFFLKLLKTIVCKENAIRKYIKKEKKGVERFFFQFIDLSLFH